MNTAKVFTNGRSQAIRLPKEYRFDSKEVYINKIDNVIMIFPKSKPWESLVKSLDHFSDDFMEKSQQPEIEKRDKF